MARFTKKLGGRWQAHHILEVQFAELVKVGSTDRLPAVLLSEAEHKLITARLAARKARVKTADDLWLVYKEVYQSRPTWLEAIRGYFNK